MKPGATGLKRVWNAFFYSMDGLTAAWRYESAVRQELTVLAIGTPLAAWMPIPLALKLALIGSIVMVLMVELLNSAIEAVVDLVSPEQHPLAKRAKDMGSAAVMLAIIIALAIWFYTLLGWSQHWFK